MLPTDQLGLVFVPIAETVKNLPLQQMPFVPKIRPIGLQFVEIPVKTF
jgi:hypothetical protein